MRSLFTVFFIIFLTLEASQITAQEGIPEGIRCAECGMKVDRASRFSSWVIEDTEKRYFCDIGDMLNHYRNRSTVIKEARVRDFISGEWIDARSAFYVRSNRFNTPMSWNIAAFKNKKDAEGFGRPVLFDKAFELLK